MTAPVAEARRNQVTEVRAQLDTMLGQFAAVLPTQIPPRQFARVVLTGIQNNPELLECERRSLWNACMKAAQDGLLPDGRLGALVVYKDKRRGKIAQWLPMIAGLRQKVRNSGEIATWQAQVVRERDHYEYEEGDNPRIVHRPVRGQRGEIIAAYSVAVLRTGEHSREWMWIEEILDIRKRSRAGEFGPWVTDFAEMCKKTVCKRHSKVLPMSTDVDTLMRRDDEVETDMVAPLVPDAAPPRSLTDALNMIAEPDETEPETQEHQVEPEPHGEQQAALELEPEPDTASASTELDEQSNRETDLERTRTMLVQAADNHMLEEFWPKVPEEYRRALAGEYRRLKGRARARPDE